MGKEATDIPNVYMISLGKGQKRFWCGVCKKFLSNSSGGNHTCDPDWRQRLAKGRKSASAGGKSSRKWRLTPGRKANITVLLDDAAKFAILAPILRSIAKKDKKVERRIEKKLKTKQAKTKYNSLMKRIGFK